MSQEVFIRGLFCGIGSLVLAWVVFSRYDCDIGSELTEQSRQRYLPYPPGNTLPAIMLVLCVLGIIVQDLGWTVRLMLSVCFSIFWHISLYYLVLLPILPLLRRRFSARACAMLWLLPNFLYIFCYDFMELPSPLLVIALPGKLAWILMGVWFVGFAAVLVWKIVDHLRFRRRLLRDAVPVTDESILLVWQELVTETKVRVPKCKLMISSNIPAPLTVGLFQRSVRVLLPQRSYTRQELMFILHHEIVHIGREDAWSKFFMVFCTAVCWFHPLMWIAMKKSAEDIELSCDETVLLQADHAERKQYAHLLLDTAGDARGFTTCLSASAEAMRYRLKRIMEPGKRRSGALLVGAVFFVLSMTLGYVSLTYGGQKGHQVLSFTADAKVQQVSLTSEEGSDLFRIADREKFDQYIGELTLYNMTGNYSFSDSECTASILLKASEQSWLVSLYDQGIEIQTLFGKNSPSVVYYVQEGIDWEYVNTMLKPFWE